MRAAIALARWIGACSRGKKRVESDMEKKEEEGELALLRGMLHLGQLACMSCVAMPHIMSLHLTPLC